MKKYFAVQDPYSGREMLYQVVHGTPEEGFEIVAAGYDIGAFADSILHHAEKRKESIDIHITPPEGCWIEIKPESASKSCVSDEDVEFHQMKRIPKGKMNRLMSRLHDQTKDADYILMFCR